MSDAADAFPFRPLPPPLRYAIALAAVSLVYLVSRSFDSLIDEGSQFLLLGTAVMASAWFVGTGPALAATVVGALLGAWDGSAADVESRAAQTHLALFVVQGLLLTGVISELRAARQLRRAVPGSRRTRGMRAKPPAE